MTATIGEVVHRIETIDEIYTLLKEIRWREMAEQEKIVDAKPG